MKKQKKAAKKPTRKQQLLSKAEDSEELVLHTELLKRFRDDMADALGKGSITTSDRDIRYLHDLYETVQRNRIRLTNALSAAERNEVDDPCTTVALFAGFYSVLEDTVAKTLAAWTKQSQIGQWAMSITGIGPILAAGLIANIDIEQCPSVSSLWRFAGQDPTLQWLGAAKATALVDGIMMKRKEVEYEDILAVCQITGQNPSRLRSLIERIYDGDVSKEHLKKTLARQPWNAGLKKLCWKLGDSFVKVHNNPNSYYGRVYEERKAQEIRKNAAGDFKSQADEKSGIVGKSTEAYKAYKVGKLPPKQIDMRARRYAVKRFLAHYWEQAYRFTYGKEPPTPYIIGRNDDKGGSHAHYEPASVAT